MVELTQAREALHIETSNKEAGIQREEEAREHFEQEKAEFLSAIQENMQVLDGMLKQYAVKSQ